MSKLPKPSKLHKSLQYIGKTALAGGIGALASGDYATGVAVLIAGALVWGLSEYKDEFRKYLEGLSE